MGRVLPGRRDKYHNSRHPGSHQPATDTSPPSELGSIIRAVGSYLYPISKRSLWHDLGNLPSKRPSLPHRIPRLYFALRQANRTVTLIATIFNMVFVAVDVGVDIPLRLSLIGLSNSYASTNGDTRAAYLATGQLTMDLANLTALVATFLQFSAIILASYAMLKSQTFKKSLGYIGILSGVLGLLFIPTFAMGSMPSGLFNIGGFIFLVVWSLLVGLKLYKLG